MSQTGMDRTAIASLAVGRAASEVDMIEALHGFAQHIADAPNLSDLLRSALLAATRLTGARHATALLLDDQAQNIRYRVALESGNLAPLELIAKPKDAELATTPSPSATPKSPPDPLSTK